MIRQILVRLPNWLGDAVMATPALNNLVRHYPQAEFTAVAQGPIAELFAGDHRFRRVLVDDSRGSRLRPLGLWSLARRTAREAGPFDLAVLLPNSVSSRFFGWATRAHHRVGSARGLRDAWLTHPIRGRTGEHMVEFYNRLVNGYLGTSYPAGNLSLTVPQPQRYRRPTMGISPGAAYGSAKRWEPHKFAAVARELAAEYDIVIFGGPSERTTGAEIESELRRRGSRNCRNLAGETTIRELVAAVAGLDLFLANDSGAMHVAAALGIPTVAIFGPTNPEHSRPWTSSPAIVVRHQVPCAPCMRRTCPLKHHACMRDLTADQVVRAVRSLADRDRAVA